MITHLSYSVRFRQTGRVLSQSLTFGKGLTAITGPNEAGKSFVIEMIRYAFFGSAALRGVGEDYDNLSVSMKWGDYRIDRTLKGGTMHRADAPLAVGTRALNAKVIEILGFGLDVFDISCICNQGEVERLGAMPASERKAMVDRVIGVHRIEEVQKWTGEQATLLCREVEVLRRGLREPVEPIRPNGYICSAELAGGVGCLRDLKREHDELVGWLSHPRTAPVSPPPLPERDEVWSIEDLEMDLEKARAYAAERARIAALPVVDFDVEAVAAQWASYDTWVERTRFQSEHPLPALSQGQVDALRERATKIGQFHHLTRELNRHLQGGHVCCPSCNHEFPLGHNSIVELRRQLTELGDFDHTPVDLAWVAVHAGRIADWVTPHVQLRWIAMKDASDLCTTAPAVSHQQMVKARSGGHVSSNQKATMLAALQPPKRSESEVRQLLTTLRRWHELNNAYANELPRFTAWSEEYAVKLIRKTELAESVAKLPEIEERLRVARLYEGAVVHYERELETYTALSQEITDKSQAIEDWRGAKQALAELRLRIKTYLVPSLSRVASHLLSQMTDGARSSLIVDENFDVVVDGQRLETLSGSGKACANLALRIGLGQVLTNKVVSLFVGDEIDASMDAERAKFTHSSIQRLTGTVSQILLITHKMPLADTVVTLGGSSDEGRVHPGGDTGDGV